MRTFVLVLFCSLLLAVPLLAEEQTTEDCMSPDYKHHVYFFRDSPESPEFFLRINGQDQSFSKPANGWVDNFAALTSRDNFRCLWSPDSKLVAVFTRDTKRSGSTLLCAAGENKIQEITFPDFMPRLRPHLNAEVRAIWVRPELWLPRHRLLLSVEGLQQDEEHGAFRFILALRVHQSKAGRFTARIVSFQQDCSVPFSVR